MKKSVLTFSLAILLAFLALQLSAQVGINDEGAPADNSAMLDVKSATKGFLPPRLALVAANVADPVTAPAPGLLVYNTAHAGTSPNAVIPGYYFWNGSRWAAVTAQPGTTPGEMQFWNGSNWILLPPGNHGQTLSFCEGVPTWGGCPPLVTTTAVTDITATSATCGGEVVNQGLTQVTERGVCWSVTPNPTLQNPHTSDGSGTGVFTSSVAGLAPGTTYYLRAFGVNSQGVSFGTQVIFTTLNQ